MRYTPLRRDWRVRPDWRSRHVFASVRVCECMYACVARRLRLCVSISTSVEMPQAGRDLGRFLRLGQDLGRFPKVQSCTPPPFPPVFQDSVDTSGTVFQDSADTRGTSKHPVANAAACSASLLAHRPR